MALDEKEKNEGWHDDLGDSADDRDASAQYWEDKFNQNSSPPEQDNSAKSPDEIRQDEEAGSQGTASGSVADKVAGWVTELAAPEASGAFTALTALKSMFWSSKKRRRAVIGAGVTGTLTGGGLLMLIFISGPLALVHLAQTLEKGYSSSQHIGFIRSNKLLGYASAQNSGETRLGLLSRQYIRGSIAELSDIGVTFSTNSNTNLNGVEVDTTNENLKKKFPELEGMSPDQQKAWVAEKLGVSLDDADLKDLGGGKFSVTKDPAVFLGSTKTLLKNVLGSFSDGGSLSSAMKARLFSKYFGIPSLFHPLERAAASTTQKIYNFSDAKSAAQEDEQAIEKQAKDTTVPNVDSKAKQANDDEKGKTLGRALFVLGGVCDIREVGLDINDINRALVVAPAVALAAHYIAIGSQVESGKDYSASQINGIEGSLTNSQGQNIFAGDAMQALEGSTAFAADQTGPGKGSLDLPESYKQAFLTGKDSSGFQITAYANAALAAVSVFSPGTTCNSAVQLGISLGFFVGDLVSEVGSAGTATPLVIGEIVAIQAAKQIPGLVVSAGVTDLANHLLMNGKVATALEKDAISGPIGGDLLAYGAETGGQMLAEDSGAVMSAGSSLQAVTAYNDVQQQAKQQFESRSFFARMFDIHDYRSLIGRMATSISPSFRQNIMNFASDIGSFGSVIGNIFTNFFSAVFPHASAASTANYCWGQIQPDGSCTGNPMPTIPDNLLNSSDPTMDDPYWNACSLFSCQNFTDPVTKKNISVDGSIVNLQGQIVNGQARDLAKECFNLDINNDGGQWGASTFPNNNVNVDSNSYIADCNLNTKKVPKQMFERLMLLAADSTSMAPMACASGDAQSCSDLGFSGSGGSTSQTTSSTPSSGNAEQLAQQILANKNISLSGRDVQQDVQAAANGQPGSAGVMTSSAILQLIETLGQSHSLTISAIQSGGTGHCNNTPKSSCPNDPHYTGDAVDFSSMDGTIITGRNAPAITIMQTAFNLLPSGSGFGQNQCGSQYTTNSQLPNNDITFNDTCNHLHVQVPAGTP